MRGNQETFTSFHKCNVYLTSYTGTIGYIKERVVWCSFIWFISKDNDVHQNHGESIWRFIPTQWRPWWIGILRYKLPEVYKSISIDRPTPTFKDKKIDTET